MDNYKHLEKTLNHIIKKMNDSRSIFCENSRTDFIRSRKLDFQNTIKILFCMENGSLSEYSDTGRPLVTVEKSTQYAGQVHLTKKLNTVGSPQLI